MNLFCFILLKVSKLMLRFPLYLTVREAGGWQGSLISASPSGVSGRLSPIKLCMNRGIAVLSTRELTSLIQTFFFFSPLKKKKNNNSRTRGKIHTLICWNGIICRSHLDLFREAKGRSVTVKCTDFCILSLDELFRCSIDNICISAKLSGPPFFFIQRPRLFVQDLAPTLNHRISEKKQLLFLLL